jgi:hypothetical protein
VGTKRAFAHTHSNPTPFHARARFSNISIPFFFSQSLKVTVDQVLRHADSDHVEETTTVLRRVIQTTPNPLVHILFSISAFSRRAMLCDAGTMRSVRCLYSMFNYAKNHAHAVSTAQGTAPNFGLGQVPKR